MTSVARPPETGPPGNRRIPWRDLAYRPSVFIVLAGVWLMIGPLMVGTTGWPAVNDVATGAVIAALATVRMVSSSRTAYVSLVNVGAGCWLVGAPFILGYAEAIGPSWNDIVVGFVVIMLAGVSWLSTRTPRGLSMSPEVPPPDTGGVPTSGP